MKMQKLKLDLDTLRVDSFETAREASKADGTVHGHQMSAVSNCGCASTVFSTGCYDLDGDTVYDYFAPGGPRQSEVGCTHVN
jgi:hypothetical protein